MTTEDFGEGCDILIVGAGKLVASTINVLCGSKGIGRVKIIGRNPEVCASLVLTANVRCHANACGLKFGWEKLDDNFENIEELVIRSKPKILLNCTSLQSPWELHPDHEWGRLVAKHGFGSTSIFQLPIALKLANIINENNLSSFYINACYPDVVNPIIQALGVAVDCGVGNVAIIEKVLRYTLRIDQSTNVKILGHHFHVGQLIKESNQRQHFPRIWIEDQEVKDVEHIFRQVRLPADAMINNITGLAIAELLLGLMVKQSMNINLPGVNGLPGGQPVSITNNKCKITLPMALKSEVVDEFYAALEIKEGVIYRNGELRFHEEVHEFLGNIDSTIQQPINLTDLPKLFSNINLMNNLINRDRYEKLSFR